MVERKSRIAPGRGARAVEGTVTPRSEMRNREQDCFILLVYMMLGLEHQMRRSGANFLEFFSALIQLNVMRSDHGTALALVTTGLRPIVRRAAYHYMVPVLGT